MTKNYIQIVRDDLEKESGCHGSLLDLYTLLAFTLGQKVELIDVHDAWAIDKNKKMPDHRSLVPFDDLSREVQELDRKYCDAIITVAKRHNL